jgi:hypothetical protein
MASKPGKAPAKRRPAKKAAAGKSEIVQTLNVNAPGKTYPRNAAKYEAARKVFLKVIPRTGAGVTQSEMMALMKQALAGSDFGSTVGWWTKTVQLDAEARGEVVRDGGKPLRWKRK